MAISVIVRHSGGGPSGERLPRVRTVPRLMPPVVTSRSRLRMFIFVLYMYIVHALLLLG